MAAGLAAAALKDIATVSSAGVEAWGQPASPKTLELMQRRHGIDLSAQTLKMSFSTTWILSSR
jgi:protein-tyrosine-phosphatase